MTGLDEQEINALLERLELEEQDVSRRRQKLFERIALFPDTTGHLADQVVEISKQRLDLHVQIDALRAQRSLQRSRRAASTD